MHRLTYSVIIGNIVDICAYGLAFLRLARKLIPEASVVHVQAVRRISKHTPIMRLVQDKSPLGNNLLDLVEKLDFVMVENIYLRLTVSTYCIGLKTTERSINIKQAGQ